MYIEGLDLLQGKYTLASKNLDAKKVKEVHVIENHQPVMTLKGKTFSDRAALNLILTEDAKNTMLSIVTLGGGVNQTPEALYDNRLMTMLFSAEQQNISIYKGNNIGENLKGELANLTHNLEKQRLGIEEYDSYLTLPKKTIAGLDNADYLFNKSHMFATNQLIKLSKPTNLRIQGDYIYDKETDRSRETTSFLFPDSSYTFAQANKINRKMHDANLKLTFERNDSSLYFKSTTEASTTWSDAYRDIIMQDKV